jgi:triphosphoribosyl-dephospho-CoA synthase
MSACLAPSTPCAERAAIHAYGRHIARLAVRALYDELLLYPKPGLVSPVDNGSHTDMNATTFMRSLFAVRHYFAAVCAAGSANATFATLRRLGIEAETRMLKATGGINTHRGAIFSLGLLCATLGRMHACAMPARAGTVRAMLMLQWGEDLAAHVDTAHASHGMQMAALHGAGGAREEAALGMPSLFDTGLPALRAALAAGRGSQRARVDAFFALLGAVDDTNVLYRGGAQGAALVRESAAAFIAAGGTGAADWRSRAVATHAAFVARRLSPGGAADLLAATCLVHAATRGEG